MATTSPLVYFTEEVFDLLFLMGESISLMDFLGLPLLATIFVFVLVGDVVLRGFLGTGETEVLRFFGGEGEVEEEEDSEVVSADFVFFLGDEEEDDFSEVFLFLGEETDNDSFEDETGEDGGVLCVSVRPFRAFSAFLFTGLES